MSTLLGLFRGLEALYGSDSGIDPRDHLQAFSPEAGAGRERVAFREIDGVLEVGMLLDGDALERLEREPATWALSDAGLAETLPIVEGLSHLLYLAEAARRERPISGLELETQAEVDKLALCLLQRWPVPEPEFADLIERLFVRFALVDGLSTALEERYLTANRIAFAYARKLAPLVAERRLNEFRGALRRFWQDSMAGKHALAA